MLNSQENHKPLRSCKLRVVAGGTSNMHYVVEVKESRAGNDKVDTKVIDVLTTRDARKVYSFMMSFGVPITEIQQASVTMEQMGHNVANFGWFGGFISSMFDGVLQ